MNNNEKMNAVSIRLCITVITYLVYRTTYLKIKSVYYIVAHILYAKISWCLMSENDIVIDHSCS